MAQRNFSGKVKQGFQPKVGQAGYLVALFRETDRQQMLGKSVDGSQFCGNAGQKHGLSHAARADEQHVLARRRADVSAERLKDDVQLVLAYRELRDQRLIGLVRSRIELANGMAGCLARHSRSGPCARARHEMSGRRRSSGM